MKKALAATSVIAAMLAMSGCSTSSSTQSGGGISSPETTVVKSQAAADFKPGTVQDVIDAGWLAGTALPVFEAGRKDKVDVVATGEIAPNAGGTTVQIAIRNNTADTITNIDVSGAAKDATGKIVGSGKSQGLKPTTVPAGGIALGYVYYSSELPADSKIDFTVSSEPLVGDSYFQDLKIDEANNMGDSITGQATNVSELTLNGPYSVEVYCFEKNGKFKDSFTTYATPDADLQPKQSVTFQTDLYGEACPTFLVGASGYGPLF